MRFEKSYALHGTRTNEEKTKQMAIANCQCRSSINMNEKNVRPVGAIRIIIRFTFSVACVHISQLEIIRYGMLE